MFCLRTSLIVLVLSGAAFANLNIVVNCSSGNSLQAAINLAIPAQRYS